MMKEFEKLDIDWNRYDQIRENHAKFIESDKKSSRSWECRVCGKITSKLSQHLKTIHNITNSEYYRKYVDNNFDECLIIGCEESILDFERFSHRLPLCCDNPLHSDRIIYLIRSRTMTRLDNEWWEDKDYQNKTSERNRKVGFTSERISKINLENWKDPKYREKMEKQLKKSARLGKFKRNKSLAGSKILYVVQLNDSLIKLGTSAEQNKNFYRFNQMKSIYKEIFHIRGDLDEITQLEIDLLDLTEEFYRKPSEEEYNYSLFGHTEVRKIECLEIIINELNRRGYNVKTI